jgi:UDP-sulfoquinovose synthase
LNILLTGIDGYIGWPTALKLSKSFGECRIIGVDNLARRKWVRECGSVSAIPIRSMEARIEAARDYGFTNISFVEGDLTDSKFVKQLFDIYKFDIVIHTAAQPSAPYAHLNGERACFTQFNNNQANLNLLWAIKEKNLEKSCHFMATTTTGVYGAPEFEIPEGFVLAENKGNKELIPFAGMAGSWYHMSKSNDVNNMWLANRLWGLSITDLRTSIVYGTHTAETKLDPRLSTRFDFDFYFGVVFNRFCAMALTGFPITIYGKGEQRKPQISLEDCVQSIVNAAGLEPDSMMQVYNQSTEVISIVDMANAIKQAGEFLKINPEVIHIPNPRVEKEEHKMKMDTSRFSRLLLNSEHRIASEAQSILKILLPYREVIAQYKDRFMVS